MNTAHLYFTNGSTMSYSGIRDFSHAGAIGRIIATKKSAAQGKEIYLEKIEIDDVVCSFTVESPDDILNSAKMIDASIPE